MRYEDKPHAVVVDMSQFCGTDYGGTQLSLMQFVNNLPARKRLVLDFAGVNFISSSMIGVCVFLNKAAKQIRVDLRLRNISPSVMELFQLTKLHQVFDIGTGNYGEEPPESKRSARAKPPSGKRDRRKSCVTDMDQQLDDSGELSAQLPPAARKIACFNTLLIDQATELFPADDQDSGIRCRTKECHGAIHVTIVDSADDLEWHCPACGLNGRISHWQGTKWDRTVGGE